MAHVLFHDKPVDRWIGLKSVASGQDLERCPRNHDAAPCALTEAAA